MNPKCELPGCGREMVGDSCANWPHFVCGATPEEHRLCAKLAESEAKVKELEAKLARVDEAFIKVALFLPPFNRWASEEQRFYHTVLAREEARKKGAEHGE